MNLPSAAAACASCHTENRWILHHVRLRGTIRRLCTSCVLTSHSSCFCPNCFIVYDPDNSAHAPPPPDKRVTCVKCSSTSHSACLAPSPPASTYLCPPCASPKFAFFDDTGRVLDKKLALVLLCAARIASASMAKAAVGAREEAVKRASEASLARKRAREALDNLAVVVSREGARKKEALDSLALCANREGARKKEGLSGEVVAASPAIKDKVPERGVFSAVKLENSGGNVGGGGGGVSLGGAVGLRQNHSEGFDRFVAETSCGERKVAGIGSRINVPRAVDGGERKILGTGSGINVPRAMEGVERKVAGIGSGINVPRAMEGVERKVAGIGSGINVPRAMEGVERKVAGIGSGINVPRAVEGVERKVAGIGSGINVPRAVEGGERKILGTSSGINVPRAVEGGGERKVVGIGSGVVNGNSGAVTVSEKEKLGNVVVKVDGDKGHKPPLENCNGKDEKISK